MTRGKDPKFIERNKTKDRHKKIPRASGVFFVIIINMEGHNFLDRKIPDSVEISEEEKKLLTLGRVIKNDTYFFKKNIYFKGKRIGYIALRECGAGNLQSIYEVKAESQYRKKQKIKGIGKEIYRRINQELNKQGKVLTSEIGGITSSDAKNMWESLIRSGEAEVIIDDLTTRGIPTRYKFKDQKSKES